MKDRINNQNLRVALNKPLQFTEDELEEVRKTPLYTNIEGSPVEVLLVLCSFIALNKSFRYAAARLKDRFDLILARQVFDYIRLREPFLSIIKRFKDLLEYQIQYIPIYSKQVRLKELQRALNDAKSIQDVPTRTKSIVEVLRAAQVMLEGKKVNIHKTQTNELTLYQKIIEIHQSNAALPERREALGSMAELFGNGRALLPANSNGESK